MYMAYVKTSLHAGPLYIRDPQRITETSVFHTQKLQIDTLIIRPDPKTLASISICQSGSEVSDMFTLIRHTAHRKCQVSQTYL